MKIRNYKELGYSTYFNPDTGFFLRAEYPGFSEPQYGPAPEMLDISITNWCDLGCDFCYRGSSPAGGHMRLEDYSWLIQEAAEVGVYQVALGGGNPNQHPDFCEILRMTREDFDIVPNYTTNGRGLTDKVLKYTKKYCGAVALSITNPRVRINKSVRLFLDNGIPFNLHYVLSCETLSKACDLLKFPPDYLNKSNAIVFLNYKDVNSCSTLSPLRCSPKLSHFLNITRQEYPFGIGFDSCMVSALKECYSDLAFCIEGCDSARFSMFVDEQLNAYPCSFMEPKESGESLRKWQGIKSLWENAPRFKQFRNHFMSSACDGCEWKIVCMNGCPLFDSLQLCC